MNSLKLIPPNGAFVGLVTPPRFRIRVSFASREAGLDVEDMISCSKGVI